MKQSINFNTGIISIPTFESPIGVHVRTGQRIRTDDTGNVYAVYRNVSSTEVLSDVSERDFLESGEVDASGLLAKQNAIKFAIALG